MIDAEPKRAKRGFAAMDPEKQREIARKGGKSVPDERRSFSQSPALASRAGKKGGRAVDPAKRMFARDPLLASEAGIKGGRASQSSRKKAKEKP
jgi:general stress protein YciG